MSVPSWFAGGTSSLLVSGSMSKKPTVRPWALPVARRQRWQRNSSGSSSPPQASRSWSCSITYYLCPTVVKACREPRLHVASTLKSNRSLFKHGWKLKAGCYGRNLFRRRRTDTLDLAKPDGPVRYCFVDAGWLEVSKLGPLPVVFSRKGTTRKLLGLVADDPQLSAADLIQTYEKRWTIAPWVKDTKQLLGLGQYQNRPYRAAVTHLHLVCFAYACLTHLRIERHGAQGQRTRKRAADVSTAAAQDQLRALLWTDLITYLKEKAHGQPVIDALERLRVA
jgi:hypothetical protein